MKLVDIKTAKITSKGQIVIPKEIREAEGLKEGTKVAVLAYSDRIEIRPLKGLKRMAITLLSEKSLSKDWETKEEDKAWKNL